MKLYWLRLLLIGLVCVGAHADDTEIYLGNPNSQSVKPNIVFVFDTSGSMKEELTRTGVCQVAQYEDVWVPIIGSIGYWRKVFTGYVDEPCEIGTGETRLEVSKKAAVDTINNLSGVNIALMKFNEKHPTYGHGGYFLLPMKSVDDADHKSSLIDKINSLPANANTPMVESVYEAYQYYTGGTVKYGKKVERKCYGWDCWDEETELLHHTDTYTGSLDNASFKSPITESCQKNHIVLFTDGAPTYDYDSDTSIINLRNANFSLSELAKVDGFIKDEELLDSNLKRDRKSVV